MRAIRMTHCVRSARTGSHSSAGLNDTPIRVRLRRQLAMDRVLDILRDGRHTASLQSGASRLIAFDVHFATDRAAAIAELPLALRQLQTFTTTGPTLDIAWLGLGYVRLARFPRWGVGFSSVAPRV